MNVLTYDREPAHSPVVVSSARLHRSCTRRSRALDEFSVASLSDHRLVELYQGLLS